jgi:hypothetical protein
VSYYTERGLGGLTDKKIDSIHYGEIVYAVYGSIKDSKGDYLRFPAIIGAMTDFNNLLFGTLQIHLASELIKPLLKPDQTFVTKPLLSINGLSGSGIWLSLRPTKTLHVTEGLENALSIASALGVGNVCATVTAPLMRTLLIPEHVENVHIWIDEDKAGIDAADKLKERYGFDKDVFIHRPSDVCVLSDESIGDWNDIIVNEHDNLIGSYYKELSIK